MQDARRNQVQDELASADVHRVSRVVSALIARDDREVRRQQIDDLALAFIAPLGAEHAQIHAGSMIPCGRSGVKRRLVDDDALDGATLTLDALDAHRARRRTGRASRLTPSHARTRRARRRRPARGRGAAVYGVNTGFGALADVAIPADQLAALQLNLLRSHAAGVGEPLPVPVVRALLALRANVLAKGFSGIRVETSRRSSRCSTPACTRACRRAGRSARAATSRRSRTWRWCSSAKATRSTATAPGADALAPRRSAAGDARAEGRPRAHQRHAGEHGAARARGARRRRAWRASPTSRRRCRSTRCADRSIPSRRAFTTRRPVPGQARVGRQPAAAGHGERDQRVARQLRQGSGRLRAALRAAGARRRARSPRVRPPARRDRSQRRHGQPDGLRRRRATSSPAGISTARPSRSPLTRWRSASPSSRRSASAAPTG